jgi:sugar transferase (PEP-CTERM/EpsH1 system associated)
MKVLWVKAGGLVPLDTGGKILSYHVARELARRHDVTLLTFYAAQPHDAHPELAGLFSRVVYLPLKLPAPKSLAEGALYARRLFSAQPYGIAKYCQPQVGRLLRRLLQADVYEVIVCDGVVAAGVIPWELPTPKVLLAHNVEAQIWSRHRLVSRNPLWSLVCRRESLALRRAERFYLAQAQRVLTVSEADRDFFASFVDPGKISVMPTGVDVDYFRPSPGEEKAGALVFTGSMDWLPNEDAVFYFAEQILPHIRRAMPDVTLWVVGRRPSRRLQGLALRDGSVRLTGQVEDVRPYVRSASVYVVPLRVGSGSRLKIFEAMAMGKAVVSTTIGAEGLRVKHGKDIILADDPEEFAASVLKLLNNSAARAEVGQAARQLVERQYGWASSAACFDAALRAAAITPAA